MEKSKIKKNRFRRWRDAGKVKSLRKKLNKFIKKLARKAEINDFLFEFIRDCLKPHQQLLFWEDVLNRKNITPFDTYDISRVVNNNRLKTLSQNKFLKEASTEQLYEVFKDTEKDFQEMLWQKIDERIKLRRIRRSKAWELLTRVIKNIVSYRENAWNTLQYLDPPDSILKPLVDLPIMKSDAGLAELQMKIEKFIRERKTKKTKDLTADLIGEIKSAIAKIQEIRGEKK